MQDYFFSYPFLSIFATLFFLACVYLIFLFPKYIPHFLLSVYSTLSLFYALTNLPVLPLTTLFILLFGPVVLWNTSFLTVRRLWPIGLYLGAVVFSNVLNNIGLWEYKSIFIPIIITGLCYLSLCEKYTEQRVTLFIYILIGWALLNTVLSILQLTEGGSYYFLSAGQAYEIGNITRGYGLIGMATQLGIVYCIAIPFITTLALANAKRRWLFIFLLLLNVIGLIISFSRGAILGTYLSIFFVLFLLKDKKRLKIYVVVTLFVILSYSAITLLFPDQYTIFFQGKDSSAMSRPMLVQTGIKMFQEKPIFGFGLGGYTENTIRYGYLKTIEAHNTFIEVLVEYGIVGLSAFFFAIFLSIKGYLRYIRNGKSEIMRTLSIGGLSCMIAILIDGYFHSFEWRLELWLPIFLGFLMEHFRYREYLKVNTQPDELLPSSSGIQ
jgi:O-antigen ligase